MTELRIDSELQAWIDPLSAEEYALLQASILQDGCRDPLVVWNGWLLDGHNRYAICSQHGIPFQTVEKAGLKTKADVKIWMIENQMGRRNTTDFSRAALALKLKPLLEQQAKERQIASQPKPGEQVGQVRQNSDAPKERTDEALAKKAGVSRDTVRKVEKILEKAAPEVIEKARTGEISIHAAAKTIEPPKEKKQVAADAAPADDSEIDELRAALKDALADNEMMGRVFDADDRLKAAMDEAKRQKAVADNAERTLAAKNGEYVARAQQVTYWKNRAEKAEKALKAVAA
jgi:DNA-binding XRE family transcriptional regulator